MTGETLDELVTQRRLLQQREAQVTRQRMTESAARGREASRLRQISIAAGRTLGQRLFAAYVPYDRNVYKVSYLHRQGLLRNRSETQLALVRSGWEVYGGSDEGLEGQRPMVYGILLESNGEMVAYSGSNERSNSTSTNGLYLDVELQTFASTPIEVEGSWWRPFPREPQLHSLLAQLAISKGVA